MKTAHLPRSRRDLRVAMLFLLPNMAGFLFFTLIPILVSLAGSFTTWSLKPSVPLRFVGLGNYVELFSDPKFYFYLFNTIYLLLAAPFAIAGSLALAVLLSEKLTVGGARFRWRLLCWGCAVVVPGSALLFMAGGRDLAVVVLSCGLVAIAGLVAGTTSYRTLLYLPYFTAGAGTILLWTQLFNPHFGLINHVLEWVLPAAHSPGWLTSTRCLLGFLPLPQAFNNGGFGLGAREAIMIMGLWASIGGNNMILYLAAISNIPKELYEAADIDGAGGWQRFRFVTVPQLVPTTFFIVVMTVIGGLQGGFEQARLMTNGGPAGITTTLSFYIYEEGYERLDLGYGAAIAWVLFVIIMGATLINWKYGNRENAD